MSVEVKEELEKMVGENLRERSPYKDPTQYKLNKAEESKEMKNAA